MKRAKRASLLVLPIVAGLAMLGAVAGQSQGLLNARLHPFSANREQSAAGSLGGVLARDDDGPVDDNSRAAVRRRLRSGEAGTYIGEILRARDSSLARWPDRRDRPLSVWIQPSANIDDWVPGYVRQVQDAFDEWDQVDLPVHFVFVDDSSSAEVHVTWLDHFDEPISGRTRWARDDGWWITDANIALAVHHHQGEVLDQEAMRAMALHEIGHLLGLDHTQDATSIMAAKVRVRDLSDADRATVRLLYSLPPGAVR